MNSYTHVILFFGDILNTVSDIIRNTWVIVYTVSVLLVSLPMFSHSIGSGEEWLPYCHG